MNLKTELINTMTTLGLTEPELALLYDRMMGTVTGLEAQITALDTQIATLTSQRGTIVAELAQAKVTVSKLITE